jgi:site-specific DNA recombinase
MVKMGNRSATQIRCAIYTRKSSEEGLDQSFNSLDAQREACEAYIASQAHEGWCVIPKAFDDGGFSGGNVERPALTRLLNLVRSDAVDVILVYKLDRLSRSLADFVRLIELFDQHNVSFVSITQSFNTSTSMGRLTLNVLLSFAQFEREVTGERIRDKIAASKKKGMWMGGRVPLGYDLVERELHINQSEAVTVRHIFDRYLALGCVRKLKAELDTDGYRSKPRPTEHKVQGEKPFSRGVLYSLLKNPLYLGKVHHDGKLYKANHPAIVDTETWQTVQAKLNQNRTKHAHRQDAKHPSLLAGRLTDHRGNRLSPTYTQRNNRRYSYYINQAILQYREDDAEDVQRIPASELNQVVEALLLELLCDTNNLIDNLSTHAIDAAKVERLTESAATLHAQWGSYSIAEKIPLLSIVDAAVVVSANRVKLSVSCTGLCNLLLKRHSTVDVYEKGSHDESSTITLSRAVSLRRSGIGKKLVIQSKDVAPIKAHPRSVRALQRAVVKAMLWNEDLITGKVASIDALVKRDGLNRRQVYRLRQLAFLAPDIIERIADGDVPETLTLEKLKQGFPMEWQAQRELFKLG